MDSYNRLKAAHKDYSAWLKESEKELGFIPDITFQEYCELTGWSNPSYNNQLNF